MLRAVLLACALILAFPVSASGASIYEKCRALTTELNARRDPDVRQRTLLCEIGHKRAIQLAKGYMGPRGDGHNIGYVVRKLNESGVCWKAVGEAIGWTTATGTPTQVADRFMDLWQASASHWPMLSSRIYDRAGGSMRVGIVNPSRTYVVLLVADFC